MKTPLYPRCTIALLLPCIVLLSSAGAAQGNAGDNADRPPLKLTVDSKPIDRTVPAPVSYAPVLDKTATSVVSIYSTRQVSAEQMLPFLNDPVFRRFFRGPEMPGGPGGRGEGGGGGEPGGGPIPDQVQRGLGSGVIASADGYILTNAHVVAGADEVKVSIGESLERHDATVIGADELADIAVLKIEASGLQPATFGDSDQLEVGDVVLAIGNPFGVGKSVSSGIVSALGRGNLGIEQIEDFIQTDAAINMGNSGGALTDSAGRVIGINTAILSRSGGFAGVGFAIPVNLVRNIAEQIVSSGSVNRGFLGVAPQTLDPELAEQFGADRGALVADVTPDSAAEKAGLQPGDVITKINNLEVRDPRQLLLTISQLAPGSTVNIEYVRDGETATTTAELGSRPEQAIAGIESGREGRSDDGVLDGVTVADLNPQVRERLQIPEQIQGAIVTDVDPSMPAAREGGLRLGDVIQGLNRRPVQNAQEAVKLSEEIEGPKVTVRIWREGRSQFLVIDESTG